MTGPYLTHIVGPAAWASYLVNGDASGLQPGEREAADAWQEREGVRIEDVQRTADGESAEPYFHETFGRWIPEVEWIGGDVLDYVAREVRLQLEEATPKARPC